MAVMASRSHRASLTVLIASWALLSVAPSGRQSDTVGPTTQVPIGLLSAAQNDVESFGYALARAGISGGLVTSRLREVEPSTPRPSTRAETGRIRLADALKALETAHPNKRAVMDAAVVNVAYKAGQKTVCDAALDTPVGPFVFAGSISSSVQTVIHQLVPEEKLPRLQEGSVGSSITKSERRDAVDVGVAVNLARAPLRKTLNGLVASVPGTVWMLEERRTRKGELVCNLRLLRASGGLQFSANLAR